MPRAGSARPVPRRAPSRSAAPRASSRLRPACRAAGHDREPRGRAPAPRRRTMWRCTSPGRRRSRRRPPAAPERRWRWSRRRSRVGRWLGFARGRPSTTQHPAAGTSTKTAGRRATGLRRWSPGPSAARRWRWRPRPRRWRGASSTRGRARLRPRLRRQAPGRRTTRRRTKTRATTWPGCHESCGSDPEERSRPA